MKTSMNKVTLLPYQQRVVDEADDLSDRLEKINTFIGGDLFKSLPIHEQHNLVTQAYVMGNYLQILKDRISSFLVNEGESV